MSLSSSSTMFYNLHCCTTQVSLSLILSAWIQHDTGNIKICHQSHVPKLRKRGLQPQTIYIWTCCKKTPFQINMHIWEHSERQRHLTSTFCFSDFHSFLAPKINIQLSLTTQWSQPTNQKQDASISCNLQNKCRIKHNCMKSSPNWCPVVYSEGFLFQSILQKYLKKPLENCIISCKCA